MNQQQQRLILDNPNLSSSALAKVLGVSSSTVRKFKQANMSINWQHRGKGIPFVNVDTNKCNYRLVKDRKVIMVGTFDKIIENLERLLFCLDNNNGELPQTRQLTYEGMTFIK